MIAARFFPLIFNILHFFSKNTQFLFFYFKKCFHFYGRLLNAIENILLEWHCAVIFYETWKISKVEIVAQLPRLTYTGRGLLCYISTLGTFHDLIIDMTRKTAALFLCPYH